MPRLDIRGNRSNVFHFDETHNVCDHHSQVSPIDLKHEKYFQEQKQLDPIVPERVNHPISVLCPKRWFQIRLNCEKQLFVSCTSNLWEQMNDFRKHIMFLQKWILNLPDLPKNQNPETVPRPIFSSVTFFTVHNELSYSIVGLKDRESHPISILRQNDDPILSEIEVYFYTSNLLEQIYDFQKRIMFSQKWILNPQDLPQNRSLKTIPTFICFWSVTDMTILFVFTCVKIIVQTLVHFLIDQVRSLTNTCQEKTF